MLIATMVGLLMTGCAQKTNDGANEKANDTKVAAEEKTGTHKIVDHAGRELEVPDKIEKIVIDQYFLLTWPTMKARLLTLLVTLVP